MTLNKELIRANNKRQRINDMHHRMQESSKRANRLLWYNKMGLQETIKIISINRFFNIE